MLKLTITNPNDREMVSSWEYRLEDWARVEMVCRHAKRIGLLTKLEWPFVGEEATI